MYIVRAKGFLVVVAGKMTVERGVAADGSG